MAERIYGKNTVITTLKTNHKVLSLFVSEQFAKDEAIMALAKKHNIQVKVVDKRTLNDLTGNTNANHQGIVADIEAYQYASVEDILETANRRQEDAFILILDGLEDPHNLGAILRTAEASGVHGVIIPKNRSVGLNATVAKLSSGAIEHVKVARVTNISSTIKALKKQGVWVVGSALETTLNYTNFEYNIPIALVIGNEGKGISRLVKENCDALVKIPMKGHTQSLNASVSAAILMYEVVRQRD